MKAIRSLLLSCTLLSFGACVDAAPDPENCAGKCDGLGSSSVGKLMPRAPSTPGAISISRNDANWLCEVVGDKGEIVLLSEQYNNRSSALNGMLAIEENGVLPERYKITQSGASWSFVLRAGNNEVLADSQSFASQAEAQQGVVDARNLVAGIVQYRAALTGGAQFGLTRAGSEWEFALSDEEGAPLLKSQVYARRTDALTGIASVRNNGVELGRYQALDGPPRFILKAANGQEIAESSQSFASVADAETAIESTRALLQSERVANPW